MIVVDIGVIFAVAGAADDDHDSCDDLLAGHPGDVMVPTPVIVGSSWLIEDRLGPAAEAAFLRSVTSGELTRVDLSDADWHRVVELVETYADLGLGLVDANVTAVAERLGVTTIATLNHRDSPWCAPAPARPSSSSHDRRALPSSGPAVPSFAAPAAAGTATLETVPSTANLPSGPHYIFSLGHVPAHW